MTERLLIVLASMIVSVFGVVVVRRRIPHERLQANNEFTGVAYAIIGAVYGVYLAFTVVVVWEQFVGAEKNATSEAVYLSQVWRDIAVLPPEARVPVERRLIDYAGAVIDREW